LSIALFEDSDTYFSYRRVYPFVSHGVTTTDPHVDLFPCTSSMRHQHLGNGANTRVASMLLHFTFISNPLCDTISPLGLSPQISIPEASSSSSNASLPLVSAEDLAEVLNAYPMSPSRGNDVSDGFMSEDESRRLRRRKRGCWQGVQLIVRVHLMMHSTLKARSQDHTSK
jgi:hypothetical protein